MASADLYLRSYAQKPGSGVTDLYLRSDTNKIPSGLNAPHVYSQAVARAAFWTVAVLPALALVAVWAV